MSVRIDSDVYLGLFPRVRDTNLIAILGAVLGQGLWIDFRTGVGMMMTTLWINFLAAV